MTKFQGTGVALITPFKSDLSIDHEALKQLVNYNIEHGVNYLVISGTTGESVTITLKEKAEIISTINTANNGRVPMVLGVGGSNTAAIIQEINDTDLTGIDAILSVSPYYSRPTQEGIYQHFKAIAEMSPVPIIVYNVPGRTGSNMLPETTLRLANDFKTIIGIKEASGNYGQYLQILKHKPSDFLVISGDDDLALAIVLAGGSGVISVIGQAFPAEFSKMIQLGLKREVKAAYALHYKFMDIIPLIFEENNPAGIKSVLAALEITNDYVRLPLVAASQDLKTRIKNSVEHWNN